MKEATRGEFKDPEILEHYGQAKTKLRSRQRDRAAKKTRKRNRRNQ